MTLPLSKCYDPLDYESLKEETSLVLQVGIEGQHNARAWEYAMALHAIWRHRETYAPVPRYKVLDVGGAGSPFQIIATLVPGVDCEVIDPRDGARIEDVAGSMPESCDAVVSISTIEHVKEEIPFLQACHRVLAPGGLLFLTMDCWGRGGPDTAHFHWMRERIYNMRTWGDLHDQCVQHLGFQQFGDANPEYYGDFIYGSYSFCSLALTKEA